jgi:hypothetical protein
LAALRVLATYATGRKVSKVIQTPTAMPQPALDGQLVLRTGLPPKRKTVIVSGAATSATVDREAARMNAIGKPRRAQELESLVEALTRFTGAQYGRAGTFDDAALDESLERSIGLLRRLKIENTWPMRRFIRRQAAPVAAGTKVWSR